MRSFAVATFVPYKSINRYRGTSWNCLLGCDLEAFIRFVCGAKWENNNS